MRILFIFCLIILVISSVPFVIMYPVIRILLFTTESLFESMSDLVVICFDEPTTKDS